jgi:hypothetical protein
MKALKPPELEILKRVKTAKAQARQILKRNLGLLEALERIPTTVEEMNRAADEKRDLDYEGDVGCPHCNSGYDCRKCAWQATVENPGNLPAYRPCCNAAFGGLKLENAGSHGFVEIDYGWGGEVLRCDVCYVDAEDMKNLWSDIGQCRKFLEAHVDWANWILEPKKQPTGGIAEKPGNTLHRKVLPKNQAKPNRRG